MRPASLFFIHNPASGNPLHRELLRTIRASTSRFPWEITKAPGDAVRLARDAAVAGVETIVAVGGDGTVHEVVNGIMSVEPHARPMLGILPLGNGNDFAMAAGIPPNSNEALDIILRGKSETVDIGSVENERGVRVYWANSCGVGLNAKIAIRSRRFQSLKGEAKYIAAAIASIWRDHDPIEMDIAVDHHRFSSEPRCLRSAMARVKAVASS